MRDFVNSLCENGGMLEIPAEYAEYLNTKPAEILFHDPKTKQRKHGKQKTTKKSVWVHRL